MTTGIVTKTRRRHKKYGALISRIGRVGGAFYLLSFRTKFGSNGELIEIRIIDKSRNSGILYRLMAGTTSLRYFTYGSNMNLQHLLKWCGFSDIIGPSDLQPQKVILPDFRFRTNYISSKGAGAANIEECPGSHVEGVLLSIPLVMRGRIRCKEGYPTRYNEIYVNVEDATTGEMMSAMTYQVSDDYRLNTDISVQAVYRDRILAGAKQHQLSKTYQQFLADFLAVEAHQVA